MTSKCKECSDDLIIGDNWTESSKDKRHYTCSPCKRMYQRKWYKENKENQNKLSRERYSRNREGVLKQQRKKYIKDTFNISEKEYDSYFEDASCSICSVESDLVLDHCHNTGNIRGVLCRKCNMALGLLGDNLEGLKKAMEYLNEDN